MEKRKSIDPCKRYTFPKNIEIIPYANLYIVVSIETANWIILKNPKQLEFFNLLKTHNLQQSIDLFNGNAEDAKAVLVQLEAKHFENTNVKKGSDTGHIMQLHLTNGCNMRCPHCYMEAGHKGGAELTTTEIYQLLDNFHRYGGNYITLTGGEVCTRKDLFEIIKYAYQLGIKVDVLTNGTMWTQQMIREVSRYLNRIQISIDGYSEIENAKVRGKGNFAKALSTIDSFVMVGVSTDVAITPWFDSNLEDKKDGFITFARSLIEKYNGKQFNIKFTGDLLDGRNICFSKEEKERYEQFSNSLYAGTMGDVFDLPFIEFHKEHYLEDNCEYGNLTIDAEGNVFFCPSIPVVKSSANIRTDDFNKIMEFANSTSKCKFTTSN